MNKATNATSYPVQTYECEIVSINPLGANTFQVELLSPEGTTLNYQAGHYLQLELDLNRDGQEKAFSYSIANTIKSKEPRRLELFLQNSSIQSGKILEHLSLHQKSSEKIKVTLPKGQAFLQTNLGLSHLLIAAGSGISKIKCITEEILIHQPDAEVKIYWSNKNIDDFYLLDEFESWDTQNNHLNFTPILESTDANWQGSSGFIYQVIEKDFEDLNDTQTYLCGSPQMVYGTIDKLKTIGLKIENCYSDVFEYAPRDEKLAI